jgi:enoyl-CoA hydratase
VIRCEESDRIAEIVISRPPTNALSITDLRTLKELFDAIGADVSVSVILIRSDGAGFSSGIDYKEFQSPYGRELLLDSGLACRALFSAIRACHVPVVAAIHGYCCGAGVALAANCDLIVAAEGSRFVLPQESWSISHFARLIPPMRLRRAALSCEPVPAEELAYTGVIHRLVTEHALIGEARDVARALCGQSRETLVASKSRLNVIDSYDADDRFWAEQAFVLESTASELGGRVNHGRSHAP